MSFEIGIDIAPALAERLRRVEFKVDGLKVAPELSGELELATLLIPSMVAGRRLELSAGLDEDLARSLPAVQGMLSDWNATLEKVEVGVPAGESRRLGDDRGVGVFFTGGVDSFFSLIANLDEVDTIVYVLGFDLRPAQAGLWGQVKEMLGEVAKHYDKRLIVVETNLRKFLDESLTWGMTHGVALAAVGHLLAGDLRKIFIGSTFSREQLHPWGSHPDFDPLWSSSDLELVHDGVDVTRLEKLERLVEDGFPLEHLRVCWTNPEEAYNCGKCSKCFRTMSGFEVLGKLREAKTFPDALDFEHAGMIDLGAEVDGLFLEEVRRSPGIDAHPELRDFLARLPMAQETRPVPFSVLRAKAVAAGEPIVVRRAVVVVEDALTRVEAVIDWGELQTKLEVEYDLGGKALSRVGDALLIWLILPAMRAGVDLVLEDEVSEDLLESIGEAQACWVISPSYSGLRRVGVSAPGAVSLPEDPSLPWAAAFSSGVDAMFEAVNGSDKLEYLVWIEGMESQRVDGGERERVWISEAAEKLGKRLVTVSMNLRKVLSRDLGLEWGPTFTIANYGMGHVMVPHIEVFDGCGL